MISIIIPSFQDPFLQQTIDSLLQNSQGEIEVIPVLDGYKPNPLLKTDPRVKPIRFRKNKGMRAAINAGIKKAQGKFIMKCDSHCSFGPGYDKILAENCRESWLMIPRRYSLNETNWQKDESHPVRDYHFLAFPAKTKDYGQCLSCQDWLQMGRDRSGPQYDIDDTMTFQGSCWLANKKYFLKRVGFLDDRKEAYGPFGGEQVEIGLKYWLCGGKVKIIKKTWYAHLSKRRGHYQNRIFTRSYKRNSSIIESRTWAAKHWMNNEEQKMIHPFNWLLKKFWPVPTWPQDKRLWVIPK